MHKFVRVLDKYENVDKNTFSLKSAKKEIRISSLGMKTDTHLSFFSKLKKGVQRMIMARQFSR